MKDFDVTGLKKLAEKAPIEEMYEDGVQDGLQEAGKGVRDVLWLARCPIRWAREFVEYAESKVKTEDRQDPPKRLAGPILEGAKYSEPGEPLYDMFAELLARGMDSKRVNEAHPAFPSIIQQLAPDEALLLHRLNEEGQIQVDQIAVERPFDFDDFVGNDDGTYSGPGPELLYERYHGDRYDRRTEVLIDGLTHTSHAPMYVEHLEKLNLVREYERDIQTVWRHPDADGPACVRRHNGLFLTRFGELFVEACLPPEPREDWGW
jgi:hypothetical protein